MMPWFLFVFTGLASLFLTGVLRWYAFRRGLMDIPNARSSHSLPTPRGGGVAIVLTFLAGLLLLHAAGLLPAPFIWGLFGAGTWVAMIGWMDDLFDLPSSMRLAGHFAGAAWALIWLGGLPPLPIFGVGVNLGVAGHLLAAIYLVWLLNLFNFMDGIDGIAGIEAVTVCTGGALVYAFFGPQDERLWLLPVLLALAAGGFLFWNFPRARIFMGDAGSGFLGLVLGVMTIKAAWIAPELFWGWNILMGAFIVDATVTLLRRAWQRESLHKAHRSHAYQHAAVFYGSHAPVAIVFGLINLLWLLPIALLVAAGLLDGTMGLVVAYAPLAAAAVRFKAGEGQA